MKSQEYPIKHFQLMQSLAKDLAEIPAQIEEHSYSYESFGSWNCKIKIKDKIFRGCFDGKDGIISLDTKENNIWKTVVFDEAESLENILNKLREIKNS
jgi:hypothetical protein